MTYPVRVLAVREDGELEALSQDQVEMLSDVEMIQGPTLPGLLDAVYLSSSGTVDKTTGYTTTSPCIGFVVALLPLGKVLMRREGEVVGFAGLVPGDTYFVDTVTPGGITNTPAISNGGKVQQRVGVSIAVDKLMLYFDGEYLEL
jgi:hypothetical protein